MVRLTDYYTDAPHAWFRKISSIFAAVRVTQSITKIHWTMFKLPALLMDTSGTLCDNPAAVTNPYTANCKTSCCRPTASAPQKKTSCNAGYPRPGTNKPSVLIDQFHPKTKLIGRHHSGPVLLQNARIHQNVITDQPERLQESVYERPQGCNEVCTVIHFL
jgi:hypothetical protein